MGKNIIVLGGGGGGLVCANTLRKKLGREHRVILIDKNENHLFYPSLLWLIMGWRKPEQIQRALNRLNRKGIEFIQGELEEITPENNSLKVKGEKLNYDYLVVSLGAELNRSMIPKTDKIFNFYCLEGAKLVREALNNFKQGKIAVLISSLPFKCPAAPYEMALLADYFFTKNNLREKIEIEVFTPEGLPMPAAGPQLGEAVKGLLEQRKIKFSPNRKLLSIDGEKNELNFEAQSKEKFDLLLVVPPHQCPPVVKTAGLTNESGWIPVQPNTLKTKFPNVYALGDVTTIKLPGQYKPDKPLNLPKAGVFAHHQAGVVANNLASEIKKTGSLREFRGQGSCFLELGGGKAGFAQGNFYSTPEPAIKLYNPGRTWHWGKILFEKWWLGKWF